MNRFPTSSRPEAGSITRALEIQREGMAVYLNFKGQTPKDAAWSGEVGLIGGRE
jgi:hypothetical protein